MPYLLLAAFYFVGFAMGVFNNSNGDETSESIATVSIQAEFNTNPTPEETTFHFQTYSASKLVVESCIKPEDVDPPIIKDTSLQLWHNLPIGFTDFIYQGFHFSRPPPLLC